ncbi:hypothetical protein H2198_006625 [Neophaeococcomyces mojaviensis]|uniref:Uncharacterized protein n=1 Tax=Neophaeococcomyces mojaviensis TaxID=3383035 RepID=A0ACC3A2D6_9EURO|nr:hypothetical protein H2198_006625 [Knufia sp. JES_112]
MSGRPGIAILGLAAAGGVGYYLYQAGGDPKVAQKQAEADAHKASAKLKSEVPGREKEAEKKGELLAAQAGAKIDQVGAKIDQTVSGMTRRKGVDVDGSQSYEAQRKLEEAKKEASEFSQKAANEANKAIDKFDKSVTDGASKAKSGFSSWFGGK